MYCPKCGSQMEEGWVACPRCGHQWGEPQKQWEPDFSSRRSGWYPNKRQWWVIWIAAVLVVSGLMAGAEGIMFAFCVALIGALLVWKLQKG
jgi:uncharacterized membrane protein YvbJ